MFSVGLRYTLVRSVSTKAVFASGGRYAFGPTMNACVASRSFAVVSDPVKDLKGPKEDVVKKPGRNAGAKAEEKEAKEKEAKEKKKAKVASEPAKKKEKEKAKEKAKKLKKLEKEKAKVTASKLKQLEKKKANRIKAKERARELAAKKKELAKARELRVLTRTTRPPFKKPLTAYQNFMRSQLAGVGVDKPNSTVKLLFTEAATKWGTLTAGEKEAYENEGFAAEMQEYQVKYAEWKKNLNFKERRAFSLRFVTGPTRINAYSLYAKENFPKGLTGGSFSETSKQVSAAYHALSPAEKEAYARRASELRDQGLAEEKVKAEKEKAKESAKESPTV